MKSFAVFCLSTLGGVTLLALVAATGAAGLYCWHGEGGCDSLPRRVRLTTETAEGTRVYDLTPRCDATPAPEPAPAPLAATAAPVGPTQADLDALRAELAAALRRVAELEAARGASSGRAEDF